jgi:translation initiation factor 1
MAKRSSDPKRPLEGTSGPLANPFETLHLAGLPEGPTEAMAPEVTKETAPLRKGRVVLRREKSQRGGKTVVVVGDFDTTIQGREIEELGRSVRKACGCGGTVRGREIEIQGDQPERVAAFFREQGFRVAGVVK